MSDVLATVEVRRRRFTVEEYYRMAEVGILGPEDRVELIEGDIIEMSPIGTRHATSVSALNRRLILAVGCRSALAAESSAPLSRHRAPAGHRAPATA